MVSNVQKNSPSPKFNICQIYEVHYAIVKTDQSSKRGLQDLASSHDKMQGILFGDLKMQSSIDIKMMLCQWIVL